MSFNFALNALLIPTLIGIIVDGYVETKNVENSAITREFISKVTEEWRKIDQDAKGCISCRQFWQFCPVFMKLYSEAKSLKSIKISSFTQKK